MKHPKTKINKVITTEEKFAFAIAIVHNNLKRVEKMLQQEQLNANLDTKYNLIEVSNLQYYEYKQNKTSEKKKHSKKNNINFKKCVWNRFNSGLR